MSSTTFTVSDLARLGGTTVRTLHHYDEIGLLVPTGRSDAGYRLYSDADLGRLGHVLAYRACGVPLGEIAALLDDPAVDRGSHLMRQIAALDERAADMERRRTALRRALEAWQMGINLDPTELVEVFGEHDPAAYADEAQERWGDTDAYRESHRRTSSYTKEDWLRLGEQSHTVEAELADCLAAGEPAGGQRAMAAAEAHRLHLDTWFYPCSYDMQAALADMYVADPRFARHYDDIRPGLAAFVRDAILANALGHIA
jgi:MerR family transcriptional regulator, thiopeptide resistance regulator